MDLWQTSAIPYCLFERHWATHPLTDDEPSPAPQACGLLLRVRVLGVFDQQTVVDAVEDLRKLFQQKLTSGSHLDRIAEQAASDFGGHRRNCETHDGVTNHEGSAEHGDLQTYNANLVDAYQSLGAIGQHQNVDVVAQSILYRIADQ